MSAKTYCRKTAAFAGYLIQNIPGDLNEVTMDWWMNSPEEMKKFLSGLKASATAAKLSPRLSVFATISLGAIAGKKTAECFTLGQRYSYRDRDFDDWPTTSQSGSGACIITTLVLARDWTFAEAAAKVLGIPDDHSLSLVRLGQRLIEAGYTMTLAQAEEMVEATERGYVTGMNTYSRGNFFFVETGNPQEPVSVVGVFRKEQQWVAFVNCLYSDKRWSADDRLLVHNFGAPKP